MALAPAWQTSNEDSTRLPCACVFLIDRCFSENFFATRPTIGDRVTVRTSPSGLGAGVLPVDYMRKRCRFGWSIRSSSCPPRDPRSQVSLSKSIAAWRGGVPPPNWHHHPQQGGGHVSHSHENVEPGHVHSGGTLPGGTTNFPPWIGKSMNCYRTQKR